MFTFMIATYGFLMLPAPELTKVPLRHVPRMLQVATVPGTAPPPLAQPPAVLRLSVTPPPPRAPYVVVCRFIPGPPANSVKAGDTNVQGSWQGVTPEGWTVGIRPYTDNSWSRNPLDAFGNIQQGFHYGLVQCLNGASQPFNGHIYVTSDSPYSAGPAPVIWQLGSTVSPGYTFRVTP